MISNKLVVILNGPPGVGKDTIAEKLIPRIENSTIMTFKHHLIEELLHRYDIAREYWDKNYPSREWKETPNDLLDSKTPRQALIYISEDVIKPRFGQDYFGKAALADILRSDYSVYIFSDGGFVEEVEVISNYVATIVIRLHREGKTFIGDSRSYIEAKLSYDVVLTDEMIEEGVEEVRRIITQHAHN